MAKSRNPEWGKLDSGLITFARSLQVTEGVFFGTFRREDGTVARVPVPVIEKGVRGQSSEDRAKNPGSSNPQAVEFAAVPQGCDGIELSFSVLVLPNAMKPHACDDDRVREAYVNVLRAYAAIDQFRTIAELITWNVASGRFAWRNRYQTDQARVVVESHDNIKLEFDPFELDLDNGAEIGRVAAAMKSGTREDLDRFVEGIAAGLREAPYRFDVKWMAEMIPGQEIFPSQEYIRESLREGLPSRVYAKLPVFMRGETMQQASMHSQKIGAALRHIDIWHGYDGHYAIAVNPYGGIQETGAVARPPQSGKTFYEIRRNADRVISTLASAKTASDIPGDIHFLVANLVRGGVYGNQNQDKAAKAAPAASGAEGGDA